MKGKYTFVAKEHEDLASICITDRGKYHGVVSVAEEENEDGTLPFKFEYDIVDNYNIPREEFGDEFFKLIGDILVHIVENQNEDIDDEEKEDTL